MSLNKEGRKEETKQAAVSCFSLSFFLEALGQPQWCLESRDGWEMLQMINATTVIYLSIYLFI